MWGILQPSKEVILPKGEGKGVGECFSALFNFPQ